MQDRNRGWLNGLIGVGIFSGTLPATRVAVAVFDPVFLTVARAAIAGLLALAVLGVSRAPRPVRADLGALAVVAAGVVVGFPLLAALAVVHMPAARAIVFLAALPLVTALFAALRGGERPRAPFWLFAVAGAVFVGGYAARDVAGGAGVGDLCMVAAVLACGLGYAEGARLARRLGGWQVISWALVLALPAMLTASVVLRPASWAAVTASAWAALAYVSVFSMLVGFVFWYRGLVLGGIAAVGQLQLLQPPLGLGLAALVLGERVDLAMVAVTLAVLTCVAGARRYV